jgi:acyl dehydratase
MALNPAQLLAWSIAEVERSYTARDAAFYALALGLPADPLSATDLAYVYEGAAGGQQVLPAFATVLADPGFWLADPQLGLDWPRMLHAGQSLTLHRPLAPSGRLRSTSLVTQRELRDADDGELCCTLRQTSLLRGDGGFADRAVQTQRPPASDARSARAAPDARHEHRTPAQAALMFRLCADMNPLHADPAVAASAGYARPILHGMATYGVACHGVMTALAIAPQRLVSFDARFTAPVFPGETLQTRVWGGPASCEFDVLVLERETTVLRGSASFTA